METFVAAIFDSRERAIAAHGALTALRSPAVHVERAGVYGRGADGSVHLQDVEAPAESLFDFNDLPGAAGGEALDELDERLPPGAFAILARVDENDSRPIDEVARTFGGEVYRRSIDDLRTTAYRRFMGSSAL